MNIRCVGVAKKVLILSGDGINCERESARAFEEAGGLAHIIHINELLAQPSLLLDFSIFCIPGGFSFGDELRSGKILAEKIRSQLGTVFQQFTKNGGLTIGICNGFQVLMQLGAFTGLDAKRSVTLATNDHGKFLDFWVELEISASAAKSPWFQGMTGRLQLPIRHKEGRIVIHEGARCEHFVFPLRYTKAVNGSYEQSAAMLDQTGQILGLMPHPEAATHGFLNPLLSEVGGAHESNANQVKQIFQNAINWNGVSK